MQRFRQVQNIKENVHMKPRSDKFESAKALF